MKKLSLSFYRVSGSTESGRSLRLVLGNMRIIIGVRVLNGPVCWVHASATFSRISVVRITILRRAFYIYFMLPAV